MAASPAKQIYDRVEACRLLGISVRQLKTWETQGLIAETAALTFSDLLALRTLMRLRKSKVKPAQIRRALIALRDKILHIKNPLTELKLYAQGTKIRVMIEGQEMEPVSGQLLLDFNEAELDKLLSFPNQAKQEEAKGGPHRQKVEADRWFERGLYLEQSGAPIEDVIAAYRKAVTLDPGSAGALVNLGTVYFNQHAWSDAMREYRQALEVDPNYALAHFNLGNLHDERGDRATALSHYQAALRVYPDYSDAHYNIALLYQGSGEVMKAVHHWKAYLKLDPRSTWANIARRELEKLRDVTIVKGRREL